MKFCSRCGAQLGNDCAFCAACGTPQYAQTPQYAPMPQYAPAPQKMPAKQKLEYLRKSKLFFYVSIAASLLMLFLPFIDTWELSVLGVLEHSEALYEESAMVLLGWLFFLGSAACAALPLYTAKPFRAAHYVLGLIVKALVFILVLAVNSTVKEDAVRRYDGVAEAGFTFGGWLILLVLIAGLVADIKLMIDIKKYSR